MSRYTYVTDTYTVTYETGTGSGVTVIHDSPWTKNSLTDATGFWGNRPFVETTKVSWGRTEEYQNPYLQRLYGKRRDEPRRTAHAVPPGPPPVPIELASSSRRTTPQQPAGCSVSRKVDTAPPRRHERQVTCRRSRRKLRTWERT